jgi:hypothetical protein
VDVALYTIRHRRAGKLIASETLRALAPGAHEVSVRLPAAYRRAHAHRPSSLLLTITVLNPSGHRVSYLYVVTVTS